LRNEQIAEMENKLSNLLPKIIRTTIYAFIRCLRVGSRGVHQTQIWVAFKVWEPLPCGGLVLANRYAVLPP